MGQKRGDEDMKEIEYKEVICPNCNHIQTVIDDVDEYVFDCEYCNAIFRENGDYIW